MDSDNGFHDVRALEPGAGIIIHLEDNPADAELVAQALTPLFCNFRVHHVASRAEYERALTRDQVDLVITDFTLPGYDGIEALRFSRMHQPDAPVILLTGSLGDNEAVDFIKAGATDFVLKSRLARLPAAVLRALSEREDNLKRRALQAALQQTQERLKWALQTSRIAVWDYDTRSGQIGFYNSLASILGDAVHEIPSLAEDWEKLVHPDDLPRLKADLATHYRRGSQGVDVQYRVRDGKERWRWLHTIARVTEWDVSGRAAIVAGTHQDVTDLHGAAEHLRLNASAINTANNAIFIVDARAPDLPIVQVNPAFERITGYTAAEALGRNCRFLQNNDRDQPDLERLRDAIATPSETTVLLRNYRKDGSLFWNNLSIAPVRDDVGVVTHFVGIQSDVTDLKRYQAELEYRATTDPLTGVAITSVIKDRLSHACKVASRSRQSFTLLRLGIDRFRAVNESFGRTNGDEILKELARRIVSVVRQSDTVARLSGDEFAVMMDDVRSPEAAASAAQKLIELFKAPFSISGEQFFIAGSVGICLYPNDGDTAELLLNNASGSMYAAKRAGGMQACFVTRDQTAAARERLQLESDLRSAIASGSFELHYQPRISLTSGEVGSVEALVRWRRSADTLCPPSQFIPLAEETGLIVPLGSWVMREACSQMREWNAAGLKDLRVAVNLSPRQFRQPDLLNTIETALRQADLAPGCLEMEITESGTMHDPTEARRSLENLSNLGIALALDDFGTGYSSLAHLQSFPFDCLKIDQSFVRGLPSDISSEHIVRSTIALALNLDLGIIAEGVETERQRDFLKSAGCHQAQGYLFCKPLPAADFPEWLAAFDERRGANAQTAIAS